MADSFAAGQLNVFDKTTNSRLGQLVFAENVTSVTCDTAYLAVQLRVRGPPLSSEGRLTMRSDPRPGKGSLG